MFTYNGRVERVHWACADLSEDVSFMSLTAETIMVIELCAQSGETLKSFEIPYSELPASVVGEAKSAPYVRVTLQRRAFLGTFQLQGLPHD